LQCIERIHIYGSVTASGDVENDSNVDVEVLWLNGEEDGSVETEWVRVTRRITVHLRLRVEAMFPLHGHLSVALVPVGRRPQEVVDTQRTLDRHTNAQFLLSVG